MLLKLLIYGLALVTTLVTASPIFKRDFPDPEPISGDISGFVHDPSIIRRDDGTYFLFTTNNKTNIHSAPSMNGPWTRLGAALPAGSVIDLPGRYETWAPDIAKLGDTYYLYYSVSDWGAQEKSDIGVATSKTLEPGSWTDHGSIGIPGNTRYNRIDPNLLYGSPNSPPLLAFGSFWDGIFQYPMSEPPLRVAPGSTYSHLEQNTTRPNVEGPYQFRWIEQATGQDWYYLFFSGGAYVTRLEYPPMKPSRKTNKRL
jgi:arabinan endo-1,5-alpha-L-arabinosidase